MPDLTFTEQNFYLTKDGDKVFYRTTNIELHSGFIAYNTGNQQLITDESFVAKYADKVQARPDAISVLSAPKLNSCHFILVKSQDHPNSIAMAHVAPDANCRALYEQLFAQFSANEKLNIIFCGGYSGSPDQICKAAVKRGCDIFSMRIIPFGFFKVEVMAFTKEVDSIHFYYLPEVDELIIYSDYYSGTNSGTNISAIHCALDVFGKPEESLQFHQIGGFIDSANFQKALKSNQNFKSFLPVFTQKFREDTPKLRVFTYEGCPDSVAKDIEGKQNAAIDMGFDFKASNVVLNTKEKSEQTKTTSTLRRNSVFQELPASEEVVEPDPKHQGGIKPS